jgi:retron-type reverse transcriptase
MINVFKNKSFYLSTSSVQDGFLHAAVLRRGEIPMSTFGHPEVYICVPLCYLVPMIIMIVRHNYLISLKAFFPIVNGNVRNRSGEKSPMREPVNPSKLGQAIFAMIRLTKLIRESSLIQNGRRNIAGKGFSLVWVFFSMCKSSQVITKCYIGFKLFSQRSKAKHYGTFGTMGSPESRKTHGFGAFVVDKYQREAGNRLLSTSSNIIPLENSILSEIRENNKLSVNNFKINYSVTSLDILIIAYKSIKSTSNKGILKMDYTNLNEIELNYLKKISIELQAGKYFFSLFRRKYLIRAAKENFKVVEVLSFRDKIVQIAILIVLETIYTNTLKKFSYDYCLSKGPFTAIEKIRFRFSECTWLIKGNIPEYFENVNHNILIEILKEKINCEKTIILIKRFLKNPYQDESKIVYPKIGIFKESVLTPILSTIYMEKLDKFMFDLKKSYHFSEDRKILYKSDSNLFLKEKRKIINDSLFSTFEYVRYTDDFIIGIIGSKKDVIHTLVKIENFLNLRFNKEKSLISHFTSKGITFLGVFITKILSKKKLTKTIYINQRLKKVQTSKKISFKAPLQILFHKALKLGFFKKKGNKFEPTACRSVINFNHSDILAFYNFKIRNILNYYYLVNNKKSLNSLINGFKYSCALTLALKFKLRHKSKVFKKFGTSLQCKLTGKKIISF